MLDSILEWLVVILPTILGLLVAFVPVGPEEPPERSRKWRWVILGVLVCLSGLTYWQQRRADKAHQKEVSALQHTDKALSRSVENLRTSLLLNGTALQPGQEPMANVCGPGLMALIMGNDYFGIAQFPWVAVAVNGKPALTLDKDQNGGIVATFDVRDAEGHLLVRVTRNHVEVLPMHAYLEPRRTLNRLSVLDENGNVVLFMYYANPEVLVIEGKLLIGQASIEMGRDGILETFEKFHQLTGNNIDCGAPFGFELSSNGINTG